jgi:hypothetical protein
MIIQRLTHKLRSHKKGIRGLLEPTNYKNFQVN